MLVGGGKIVVAIVGAVVLLVAGLFIIKSLVWPQSSDPTGTSGTSSSASVSSSAGETTTAQESSGEEGSSAQPSTDPTTSDPTESPAEPFTATSTTVQEEIGTTAVDVELPQVQGGTTEVADSFNSAMRSALEQQATDVAGGNLDGGASTATVGEKALSGVLLTNASASDADSPIPLVRTVVVDASTGATITLPELFTDSETGLNRVLEETETLGPQESSVAPDFDSSTLTATEETFQYWTPDSDGLTLYFDQGLVGPTAAGIVTLTIPWANLDDVMDPGKADIVQS